MSKKKNDKKVKQPISVSSISRIVTIASGVFMVIAIFVFFAPFMSFNTTGFTFAFGLNNIPLSAGTLVAFILFVIALGVIVILALNQFLNFFRLSDKVNKILAIALGIIVIVGSVLVFTTKALVGAISATSLGGGAIASGVFSLLSVGALILSSFLRSIED